MRESARLILEKGQLVDADYTALLKICRSEAADTAVENDFQFPADAFNATNTYALRLDAIGGVNGINALRTRSPLEFGSDNLTIVYGNNGSGKSSYVRILKHVCGAKNPGTLHPNVYGSDTDARQCNIQYKKDETDTSITWTVGDGVVADLRAVDIFDTDCGRVYLESESEVSYEPKSLSFFSDLIHVCEEVGRRIDALSAKYVSKKPSLPLSLIGTGAAQWYSQLSPQTSTEDVQIRTVWNEAHAQKATELEKRLAETSPAEKAKGLLNRKTRIEGIIRTLEDHLEIMSDDNCRQLIKLKPLLQRGFSQARLWKASALTYGKVCGNLPESTPKSQHTTM